MKMKKPDTSRTSHISSHDLVTLWKHLGDTYVALKGFRTDTLKRQPVCLVDSQTFVGTPQAEKSALKK